MLHNNHKTVYVHNTTVLKQTWEMKEQFMWQWNEIILRIIFIGQLLINKGLMMFCKQSQI